MRHSEPKRLRPGGRGVSRHARVESAVLERSYRIGGRIRAERQDRRLSIEQLAQSAGLTVSFISQVERNVTNLSLDSLRKICRALDIPMFKLFLDGEGSEDLIVRAGRRTRLRFPDRRVEYQLLSPTLQAGLEVLEVLLEPSEATSGEPLAHRGEEVAVVIKGKIEAAYGNRKYLLEEGDAIYLVSTIPHKFTNISRGQSRLIMAIVNQFPRAVPVSARSLSEVGGKEI